MQKFDLLKILEENNYLSAESIEMLIRFQNKWNLNSYDALLESHLLSESEIADAISNYLQLERIYSFRESKVDTDLLKLFPFSFALEYQCLPIEKSAHNEWCKLVLVMPQNPEVMIKIESYLKSKIVLAIAERTEIMHAIHKNYNASEQILHFMGKTC